MEQLSAHGVRDLVIDRLVAGTYPVGSQLPTSRELAAEIGAHRNTVAKAYQLLAQVGVVTVRQGRGTFVVSVVEDGNGAGLASHIQQSIAGQIAKARRIGMPEAELRVMIEQAVTMAYGPAKRGAFVECNPGDLTAAVDEIQALTGLRLTPLLLAQLQLDPVTALAGHEVVVTILSHLKEVSDYINADGVAVELVGVHTQPDEDALSAIARITPGSRVGIIVDYPEGVPRFINRINSVTTVETTALVSPTDDAIQALGAGVDCIVCNRSRAGQVRRLGLDVPVLELSFHVSRQSIARVLEALV
jgi:DNA-binding transcriptional regulator YhcF (GntR family)